MLSPYLSRQKEGERRLNCSLFSSKPGVKSGGEIIVRSRSPTRGSCSPRGLFINGMDENWAASFTREYNYPCKLIADKE